MNFYQWLKAYDGPRWVENRRGGAAVGDLRTDVLADREWPRDARTRRVCETALGPEACAGAREALRIAWQMYRDAVRKKASGKVDSYRRDGQGATAHRLGERDGQKPNAARNFLQVREG